VEFWTRKIIDAPGTWNAAKPEAKALIQSLKNPGAITYRQVAEGGVWALQLFGCFCIGEMYGRGSIIGYDVGGPNPYHDKVHEH